METLGGPRTLRDKVGDKQVKGSVKVPETVGLRIQGSECCRGERTPPSFCGVAMQSPELLWDSGSPLGERRKQEGKVLKEGSLNDKA